MGFGQTLAYLRSRSKLTQQELADALGFKSKSTVSMYENGTREPDFETLEIIADYFNVDMNFLIGSDKEKPATIEGYELTGLDLKLIKKLPAMSEQEKLMLLAQVDTLQKMKE